MKFNVYANVGTSEVELAPYPGGSGKAPADKYRKFYVFIFTNTAAAANTLTLRVYRDATLEASFSINLSASETRYMFANGIPLLILPPERTLKAVASSASVMVLMTGEDE